MLSGEWFLTKGQGKEEGSMCQLHLLVWYFIQFRILQVHSEFHRASKKFAVPSEGQHGNYK